MKRILPLALCAAFACQASARTLYVDASRPNNNGNGLSAAKAKKTIQAAVNIAKKGDTIVVAPGSYAPIDTKNKKIKIKAKKGSSKTTVLYTGSGDAVANLGATWKIKYSWPGYYHSGVWVPPGSSYESSDPKRKGTSTSVSGLTLDGGGAYTLPSYGVQGGTLQSCIVKNAGCNTVCRSKLSGCTIQDNEDFEIDESTLDRCKVLNNRGYSYYSSDSSKFSNCLFACNETTPFESCTFGNCTVADNASFTLSKSTAWNTIFHKVASSQFKSSKKNKLKNCYKGSNPKFVSTKSKKKTWVADDSYYDDWKIVGGDVYWYLYDEFGDLQEEGCVTVSGTSEAAVLAAAKAKVGKPDAEYDPYYDYEYGYYKTETVPGNYHLKKGSPCINKGTTATAAKKLYGTKDLDGKKRVKGKSVDIGCYEY